LLIINEVAAVHNCGAQPGASSGNEDSFPSEIRHNYSFDILFGFLLQSPCSISRLDFQGFLKSRIFPFDHKGESRREGERGRDPRGRGQ
jgi:hypothetical protein